MSEGFTVENFITVNEKKVKQWLHDPAMSKYLRPETLYGKKFDGYLNEVVCDLPATNSDSLNNNKFPSADERRITKNRKNFREGLLVQTIWEQATAEASERIRTHPNASE